MMRVIFSIIVIIGVLILAMANKESIQINYLFGVTPPLPLYLILITTFVIGGVVFTIILLPAWIKDKLEIRKLQRTLQKLETQKSET